MALGLSKLNVKVWVQIMNCNIGPPTRVIYDQSSFWTMKHRLPPNVKLHFSCNLFSSWRHSIDNPRLGIFVITKMIWLVVTWILFSIWDVILPIDSYFSRWLLHHQPDVYIYICFMMLTDVDVLMWPFLRTARFWRLSTQHVLCSILFPLIGSWMYRVVRMIDSGPPARWFHWSACCWCIIPITVGFMDVYGGHVI